MLKSIIYFSVMNSGEHREPLESDAGGAGRVRGGIPAKSGRGACREALCRRDRARLYPRAEGRGDRGRHRRVPQA